MPIVNFPEFEQYKAEGYKGTFVGGCIERGEGSSFRRRAHAHCFGQDKHMGWICVRSPKRLYNKAGGASLLMWHEMAHIITHDGHGRKFYMWLREHSTIRKDEERTSQWAYLCRHHKDPVLAYNKIKGLTNRRSVMAKKQANYGVAEAKVEAPKVDPIVELTGDAGATRMGVAKGGGTWYKNYKTGALYRIQDGKLMETRASKVPEHIARKNAVAGIRKGKAKDGKSRAELMEAVKDKGISYYRVMNSSELSEVIKSDTSATRIKEIQDGAVKRWKDGWGSKGAK